MVIKQKDAYNVSNPLYTDITVVGITKDKGIDDTNTIASDGKMYGIKFVIPSPKYLQLLMYEQE